MAEALLRGVQDLDQLPCGAGGRLAELGAQFGDLRFVDLDVDAVLAAAFVEVTRSIRDSSSGGWLWCGGISGCS
ncbi:hypothetical protein OG592_41220 (plasmid) [Streptomyces avidinii]|uniref:hypothetical protein n=1 Tax=Streptomyces avidinii TaxID=1895 RepID=UPI00386FFD84|nr:hypothetical protein OG592_41220 [Streptomyces avidinii]